MDRDYDVASEPSTVGTVLKQCNDLLEIYDSLCNELSHQLQEKEQQQQVSWDDYQTVYRELEMERAEHAQTCAVLMAERERTQCAETEVEVIRKQLEREKATFEKAFGLLKSKALMDSSKSEELVAKATGLEALCKQREEELLVKEKEIRTLRSKQASLREAHCRELQELRVKMQQEVYMAKSLGEVSARTGRRRM